MKTKKFELTLDEVTAMFNYWDKRFMNLCSVLDENTAPKKLVARAQFYSDRACEWEIAKDEMKDEIER